MANGNQMDSPSKQIDQIAQTTTFIFMIFINSTGSDSAIRPDLVIKIKGQQMYIYSSQTNGDKYVFKQYGFADNKIF